MNSRPEPEILPQENSRPVQLFWAGVGGAAILALVLLFVFDPARFSFFPRCAFHQLTGLNCPGCGGQRALHQLLHGEFVRAFQFNALFIALLPLGGWVLARQLARRILARELPVLFKHHGWIWLLTSAVLGFGILRNLPFPAFAWMSP